MKIGRQKFDTSDILTIVVAVVVIAIISALYTIIEYRFFLEWVAQRALGIDPIHPLMVFNWGTVLLIFGVFLVLMSLINRAINLKRMDIAVSFMVVGLSSLFIYVIVRNAVLGFLPINPIEWEIWLFQTQMAFLPGYYMPGWWIVLLGLLVIGMMWTYYTTYKVRGRRF